MATAITEAQADVPTMQTCKVVMEHARCKSHTPSRPVCCWCRRARKVGQVMDHDSPHYICRNCVPRWAAHSDVVPTVLALLFGNPADKKTNASDGQAQLIPKG